MQVCFAQHGEDLVLGQALAWPRSGFYVDVGAAHPTALSVTRLFYERGWRGLNIEPLPHMFATLVRERPRDVNLQLAVSDRAGEFRFFKVAAARCDERSNGSGLSTFDQALAEQYRAQGHEVQELRIPVLTLNELLDRHAPPTIDFLKLDVEGHERAALRGLDLDRHRPRILLIEAVRPLTTIPSYADWEPLVTGHGYRFAANDGVNRYYVREEEPQLAARVRPLAPTEFVRIAENGRVKLLHRWLKPWVQRLKLGVESITQTLKGNAVKNSS